MFQKNANSNHISVSKSKGLPDETIKTRATYDNSLAPSVTSIGVEPRMKFYVQCIKEDHVRFNHKKGC